MEPPPPCCFETCMCRLRHRRHGITFHEFPKNDEIRSKWLAVVRIDRRDPKWVPASDSKVCSLHFCRAQFLSKRVLHSRAVPTAKYDIPKFMRGYKRDDSPEPSDTIDLDDDIPDDSIEFPPLNERDDVPVDDDFEVEFVAETPIILPTPAALVEKPNVKNTADKAGNDVDDQPPKDVEDKPAEKFAEEPVEILIQKLHEDPPKKTVSKTGRKTKIPLKFEEDMGERAKKKARMSPPEERKPARKSKKESAETLAEKSGDEHVEENPDDEMIGKPAEEPTDKEMTDKKPEDKETANEEASDKEAVDQEMADKEPTDKEQAKKEPVEKKQAEKEQADKEQAEKEQAEKEPAEKEPPEKEPAEKEPAEKVQVEQEKAEKEIAVKEKADLEPSDKDSDAKAPTAQAVNE